VGLNETNLLKTLFLQLSRCNKINLRIVCETKDEKCSQREAWQSKQLNRRQYLFLIELNAILCFDFYIATLI
jgi:hypothetical protein